MQVLSLLRRTFAVYGLCQYYIVAYLCLYFLSTTQKRLASFLETRQFAYIKPKKLNKYWGILRGHEYSSCCHNASPCTTRLTLKHSLKPMCATIPPNFKRLVVDTCFFCIGHSSDKPAQVGVGFAVRLFRCQRRKTDRVD